MKENKKKFKHENIWAIETAIQADIWHCVLFSKFVSFGIVEVELIRLVDMCFVFAVAAV